MVNYLDYIVGYFCLDEWYVLWILFSFFYIEFEVVMVFLLVFIKDFIDKFKY